MEAGHTGQEGFVWTKHGVASAPPLLYAVVVGTDAETCRKSCLTLRGFGNCSKPKSAQP